LEGQPEAVFFWSILSVAKSGDNPLERFSQIWLQAKYKSKILETSLYIFGYPT
jgi:hypothetical protein